MTTTFRIRPQDYGKRLNRYGEEKMYCRCGCRHRFKVGELVTSQFYTKGKQRTWWWVPEHWENTFHRGDEN